MAITPEQRQKLVNAGYSASKIAAYERSTGGAMPTQSRSGFMAALRDVPSDISETVSRIGETASQSFVQKPQAARAQVDQGQISGGAGFFKALGSGAAGVGRTIGEGILGLGKLFTSPQTEENVSTFVGEKATQVAQSEPAQKAKAFYDSLNPEQQALLQGAGGFAEGAATAFGFGPGARVASTAVNPVLRGAGTAASSVSRVTGPVAKKAVELPARAVSEVQGALTGTSGETIRQAFNAARRGGAELNEFTKALRGNTTPEELVVRLREGTDRISAEKTAQYSRSLEQIGDVITDTRSIVPSVVDDLKNIGVTVDDAGKLNFEASKFRTVPSVQTKLQKMFDEVRGLGENQTIRGIDTSRQALATLMLEGDDAASRTANMAITKALDRVREAGKTVDGYADMLKQFGDDSQFLNEITRALSSGDQATIDTAYRRLATALKTNNEQRRNLLMELDEATGGYVLSSVAGQQLSEELPRGLFRQIAAGIAGASVLTGGVSAGILPALVFASPRVTGEVLRALGIAQGKVDKLLNAFTRVRKDLGVPVVGATQSTVPESAPSTNGSTLIDKGRNLLNRVKTEGKRGFVTLNPRLAQLKATRRDLENRINRTTDRAARIQMQKSLKIVDDKIRKLQ